MPPTTRRSASAPTLSPRSPGCRDWVAFWCTSSSSTASLASFCCGKSGATSGTIGRQTARRLPRRSNSKLQLFAVDRDPGRRDDQLVVTLLDDIAVDLAGDLSELVDDVFDRPVAGAVAGDIRKHQIPVVDGVFDVDHVVFAADLGDPNGHPRALGGS